MTAAKKSAPAKTAAPAPAAKSAAKGTAAKAEDLKKTTAAKPAAKAATAKAAVVEAKGKPGRKPKVDDKAKKPAEDGDVDLSDLESDLEGEPEVDTAAADTAEKVKAKPLRM